MNPEVSCASYLILYSSIYGNNLLIKLPTKLQLTGKFCLFWENFERSFKELNFMFEDNFELKCFDVERENAIAYAVD